MPITTTVVDVPVTDVTDVSVQNPGDGVSTGANMGGLVGGPGALVADDGDTSYCELWNNNPNILLDQATADYLNANGYTTDSGVPFQSGFTEPAGQDVFEMRLQPTPLPAAATITRLTWYALTRFVHGGPYAFVSLSYPDTRSPAVTADPDIDVRDATYTRYGQVGVNLYREDVENGKTVRMYGPRRFDAVGTIDGMRVTRLWLEVTYQTTGLALLPPSRVLPRDDGRLTASAGRVWPPPKSRQGSARGGPGSYL